MISKKIPNVFIDFLDELGLFIGRKTIFTQKSHRYRLSGYNFFSFNLETSPFQVSHILVVCSAY
jgi:hypothetical protein